MNRAGQSSTLQVGSSPFEDQLLSVLLEARSRRYGSGASVESLLTFFCEVNIGESETQLGPTRSWLVIHLDTELHHFLPDPKRSISFTDNTIEVRWAADQMVPPVEVAFSWHGKYPSKFQFKRSAPKHKKTKNPRKGYQRNTYWTYHRPTAISFTSVGLLLCSSTAARLLEASLGQRIFGRFAVATVLLYCYSQSRWPNLPICCSCSTLIFLKYFFWSTAIF